MKKTKAAPQSARRIKAIVAAAMALTLAVPTTAYFSNKASNAQAEEALPQAVTTVTFDKGFLGETTTNGLNVVKSEQMIMFKEELNEDDNFKYDENNNIVYGMTDTPFIEAGDYKFGSKGDQPTTAWDVSKGSVIIFDDTVYEPEFKKKASDELDDKYPIGTVLQCATVAQSQVQLSNPFAGKDLSAGASVSYWVKVPASAADAGKGVNSSLIVFGVKDDDNRKVKTTVDGSEKKAEQEAEAQLSIQISTNNDFHFVKGDEKAVAYEGDGTVLASPDTWAYVTVSMTDDKIVTYVNGKETSAQDVDAAGLMAALSDSGTGAFLGGNYSIAAEKVSQKIDVVKGVCMDDIAYYTKALTAEEAAALYDVAAKDLNETEEAVLLEHFDFENGMTGSNGTTIDDISSNTTNIEVVADSTKNSSVLKLGDGTASKTSAGLLSVNPFAGLNLEGATINYWVKEPANSKTKTVMPTVSLSFIDTPKPKNHPKLYETYMDKESQTVLYTKTDMDAMFCEGYTTQTYTSLKNTYQFSTKKNGHVVNDGTDPWFDQDAVDKQNQYNERLLSMSSWKMVTVVLTNAEIKMYINGEPLSNNMAASDDADRPTYFGPRFFDGYYQMIYDGYAPWYRSTDNQGATPLMTFLTDSTTSAYIGFLYKLGTTDSFDRSYEAYYDDIDFYAGAMNDAQVKKLIDVNPVIPDEPSEIPSETPSDSNQTVDPSQGGTGEARATVSEDGSLVAEAAGVKVEAPAGVLPEGVDLILGTLGTETNAAEYDSFKAILAKIQDFAVQDFVIYTVTAADGTVTPNGTFKLTFNIPDGFDTNALVVIDENGKQYETTISADGKTVTISGVDHFGKFAVGVKNMSTDDESVVAPKNSYSGKTGDTANVMIPVVLMAAACGAFAVAAKRRKTEEE